MSDNLTVTLFPNLMNLVIQLGSTCLLFYVSYLLINFLRKGNKALDIYLAKEKRNNRQVNQNNEEL